MVLEVLVGVLVVTVVALVFVIKRNGGVAVGHHHNIQVGSGVEKGLAGIGSGFAASGKAIEQNLPHVAKPIGEILSAIADKIRGKHIESEKLQTEAIALAQEIERLKSRYIQVDEVVPQLKLALVHSKHRYQSFRQEQLHSEAAGLLSRETTHEYVGVVQAEYGVSVGLDLDRLRFAFGLGNQVFVSGLQEPEIIGHKNFKITPLFGEIREHKKKNFLGDASTILVDDPRTAQKREAHQALVQEEIQSRESIGHLSESVAKLALAFLSTCLKPSGIELVHDEKQTAEGVNFYELCKELNRRSLKLREEKQSQLALIDQRQAVIQAEVLALTAPA